MIARRPGRLVLLLATALLLGGAAHGAAPDPKTDSKTDANQIIVPRGPERTTEPGRSSTMPGAFTTIAVLVLAGVGGWLVWRGRSGGMANFNRTSRQLAVEETRSLGGRQYLVVASYQDKKFLLGVCPGRIDLLAPLHDTPPAEKPKS